MEWESVWAWDTPMMGNMSSRRHLDPGFDGNRSDVLVDWYFPVEGFKELTQESLDSLMAETVKGDLFWGMFVGLRDRFD